MNSTTTTARDAKRAENRIARLSVLAASGLTAGAIGASMGKSPAWVRDLARAHGVKIRLPNDDAFEVPESRVHLALVADPRPKDTYERRVWNCPSLNACEMAWLDAHAKTNIATPAACPSGCPGAPR